MANQRERTCEGCGKIEWTLSKTTKCSACLSSAKVQETINRELDQLQNWGYSSVEFSHNNDHGKRSYKLITPCCGHNCSMLFGNINAMFKKYGKPPCPSCGGKVRMTKAMDGYIEKYGRDHDTAKFEDYSSKVRYESEQTYRKYQVIINPENHPRGLGDAEGTYQLDHKMSIRDCFVHSIPIELAGSILNLTMLPSLENSSKGRKSSIDLRGWVGKDLSLFDPTFLVGLSDADVELCDPENPAEHIQRYLDDSKTGIERYSRRRAAITSAKYIKKMSDYGFRNIEYIRFGYRPERLSRPEHVFKISHNGRTEVLEYSKIQTLMKNNLFLWPQDHTYAQFIKEARRIKSGACKGKGETTCHLIKHE